MLRRLVMAGNLGRKSGVGYYRYDAGEPVATIPAPAFSRGTSRGEGNVVMIDGGSRAATAELLARAAKTATVATVFAVATTDEAPVTALLAGFERKRDVVGLHTPKAPRPGVVEVVATTLSDPDAVATVVDHLRGEGRTALACRDRAGYVVDYLVLPHLGDAVRMVDDGYASREDVDAAMRLGCGYADGPFAMLAAVGADDTRSVLSHLAAATHLPSLAPSPLLDELAALGPAAFA